MPKFLRPAIVLEFEVAGRLRLVQNFPNTRWVVRFVVRVAFVASVAVSTASVVPSAALAVSGTCSVGAGIDGVSGTSDDTYLPSTVAVAGADGQYVLDGEACWLSDAPPVPDASRTVPLSGASAAGSATIDVASAAPVPLPEPVVAPAQHVSAGGLAPAGHSNAAAEGVPSVELLGGGLAAMMAVVAIVALWPTRGRRLTSR